MTDYAQVQASGGEGQADLNLWLRDLSIYVPGVHRSVFKRQLILACREFFEQSWAWRAAIGPIPVVANQANYMLSPFNSTTDVVGILGVSVNGVAISPLAQKPDPLAYLGNANPDTSNFPIGYYMLRPDVMALFPTPLPTQPTTMMVQVALKPKQSVSQVPHIAVSDFYDAITAGVLYRVLNQPAKPYSNPALAMYYENRFRTLIGTYAGAAKKGLNGGPSWRFPYFGNGRSGINGGW